MVTGIKYKLLCPRGTQTCALAVANINLNGNGKVILDTHPESDQHQNWTCSRGSPPAPTHQIWWWSMNPFLRYLEDKNSAHTHTDRQTDRHTPMTTRPCGLRRAGKNMQYNINQTMPTLVISMRTVVGFWWPSRNFPVVAVSYISSASVLSPYDKTNTVDNM